MDILCEKVLVRLLRSYRDKRISTFDPVEFEPLEREALKKLEQDGYLTTKNNLIESVCLTEKALDILE